MAIETEQNTHPNPLWLQWYGDGDPEIDGEPEGDNDVTWCRDKIFDRDVEYVPATRIDTAVEDFRSRAVEAVRALSDNQLNRTMVCATLQMLAATAKEGA